MKNNIKPQEKLYSLDKHTFSANLKDSFIDENYLDKVKIIEFCNCIDTWEQELLFSQNGFFSLKGKDVENKAEEFIRELEEFANAKVSEIKFLKPESKIAVKEIKRLKLDAISKQINKYKIQQLKEWEIEVYEQSLSVIKNKATLYKDDINIVQKSLKSALSVLELMSKQENWVEKTYKKKKEIYLSDFYSGIIDAFISEKNINAVKYFQSYSKYLFKEDKEKLEEKIKKLKVDVISYNWAKEIFSYDLSNDELEKEINNLKDKDLENAVRNFLKYLKIQEKNNEQIKIKSENEKVWNNILTTIETDKEKAFLYVDYSQPTSSQKAQKDYINIMLKNGCISTDKSEFLSLLDELFQDINSFKLKPIDDYRSFLSKEDFELLKSFLALSKERYELLRADLQYLKTVLKERKISNKDKLYDIFKVFYFERETKKNLKKDTDTEDINKLIDCILFRYSDIEKHKH